MNSGGLAMKRSCDRCGSDFEARSGRARFCTSKCRYAAGNARKQGRPEAERVVVLPLAGNVVEAVHNDLAAANLLGTPLGQAALRLAFVIDNADETRASGVAAAVRELRSTLADAMHREVKEADPIDELEAKRAKRASA
jgi:hypothetical protein